MKKNFSAIILDCNDQNKPGLFENEHVLLIPVTTLYLFQTLCLQLKKFISTALYFALVFKIFASKLTKIVTIKCVEFIYRERRFIRVFSLFQPPDALCSPPLPLCTWMEDHHISQPSMAPSSDNGIGDICRICHSKEESDSPLISPCYCTGSISYVHNSCLQKWIKTSETTCCEICKFDFIMNKKINPFRKVLTYLLFTSYFYNFYFYFLLLCLPFLLLVILT